MIYVHKTTLNYMIYAYKTLNVAKYARKTLNDMIYYVKH